MNLSIQTAIALLRQIHRFTPADFDIIGITKEQFDQVAQEDLWLREQLPMVMQSFRNLMFATLNAMGYPAIVLPSEYIAPHIATIIAPPNQMMACIWLHKERQSGVAALQLAQRTQSQSEYEQTSVEHLFALVCLLQDTSAVAEARVRYRQRLGVEITETMRGALA